jgi:hypothetical protein
LPLEESDANAMAPPEMPASTPGKRLTLQLGGSLVDDSDPRLPTHDDCYLAALGYVPNSGRVAAANDGAQERIAYYDVCHKLAAARQRLAWRFGVGLLSEGPPSVAGAMPTTSAGKTRVELYAGAVIWAPSTWVTTNLIYQHLRLPSVVDTFGGGFATGRNVGGPSSGVNAWGRIGLDVLGFVQRAKATGDSTWQARIGATFRGRIAGGAFTTISIGPRIFGSSSDVDLLSTVSLSYDVDQLFADISQPLPLLP